MKLSQLTSEQTIELKQKYLSEHQENTSYGELANADELVSSDDLEKEYGSTEFHADDFTCTAGSTDVKCLIQHYTETNLKSDVDSLADEFVNIIQRKANDIATEFAEALGEDEASDTWNDINEEIYNILAIETNKELN